MIQLDELERQVRLELVDDEAGAAVAGIHHDLQLAQLAAIDVAEQVVEVLLAGVVLLLGAALGDRRRQAALLDERGHVLEAGVGADRARLLAHEFHAVVIRWIVARRDHDAAVEAARRRSRSTRPRCRTGRCPARRCRRPSGPLSGPGRAPGSTGGCRSRPPRASASRTPRRPGRCRARGAR